jgi:hypothetical protein
MKTKQLVGRGEVHLNHGMPAICRLRLSLYSYSFI